MACQRQCKRISQQSAGRSSSKFQALNSEDCMIHETLHEPKGTLDELPLVGEENGSISETEYEFSESDDEYEFLESDDEEPPSRIGKRGPTKGLVLRKRKRNSDPRIPVEISTKDMRPVGDFADKFVTNISVIVRDNAPFNVKSWRSVPDSVKDELLELAKEKFIFGDDLKTQRAILQLMGTSYRNWRCRLHKKYYLQHETDEERLKHVPYFLSIPEWKYLVQWFGSDEFKRKSKVNKKSCSKKVMKHSQGRRSCAQIRHKLAKKMGEEPSELDVWYISHQKKSGGWSDEKSKEIYSKMKSLDGDDIDEEQLEHIFGSKYLPACFQTSENTPKSQHRLRLDQQIRELVKAEAEVLAEKLAEKLVEPYKAEADKAKKQVMKLTNEVDELKKEMAQPCKAETDKAMKQMTELTNEVHKLKKEMGQLGEMDKFFRQLKSAMGLES